MLNSILIIPLILAFGFSPYLAGVNTLMSGRVKGYGFLIATVIAVILIGSGTESGHLVNFFLILAGGSFLITTTGLVEVVRQGKAPLKGLMIVPALLLIFFGVSVLGFELISDVGLKQELVAKVTEVQPELLKSFEQVELNSNGQDFFEMKALLLKPQAFVDNFISYGLGAFFDMVMLCIWINLFFLLRANRLVKENAKVDYDEFTLLNLKMHPMLKWGILICGILFIAADYYQYPFFIGLSFIALNVLAAFYFFQGFGIYLSFLDFVKISGLIRVFLIVLTIFSARPILILVGFADEFINFKNMMIKKDQGEL